MKNSLQFAGSVIILMFCIVNVSFAQLQWRKGGNNFFPLGTPPTLGTNYNAPLQFLTNSTEKMRITPGGQVGIGTTTPQSFTHFHNPATGFLKSSFTQWTNPATTAGNARGLFVGNLFNTAFISQAENADLVFGAGTGGVFSNGRMIIIGTAGSTLGLS